MTTLSVLLFLAIIFALVFLFRIAKIGALVAFLLAGLLSGPYVLNLFELNSAWQMLGDLGILFLWFSIGLGISLSRLWTMRKTVVGFGAAQVLMVAVMLFPFLFEFTSWGVMGAVMVSLLLAMSSTSEDLQLLTSRNQLNTCVGRQSFSVLLFQDLLSVPLLAMLPVFAGKSFNLGATLVDVLVLSLVLIVGIVIVGRFILNPLLRQVSKLKSKEAFLLTILLNIVLWSVVMNWLGLPTGLGAFLAGMLMSETIYRHQISAEISPYATLFLAFFFIVLGMGINLPLLLDKWYFVLAGVLVLVAIKFFAIFMVCRVRHTSVSDSFFISLLLAQGGEFGLLMLQMMRTNGIDAIPVIDQEILIAVIVLSIMLTPILIAIYDALQRNGYLSRFTNTSNLKKSNGDAPVVLICGFGRVGQIVAKLLRAKNIPYIAIDSSVSSVMLGRERGYNTVYGDVTNLEVLHEFGLGSSKTRAAVIALDNVDTATRAIQTIKIVSPRMKIFARARNLSDSTELMKFGATKVFPETIESSFFLSYGLLEYLGISDSQIENLLGEMRSDNYRGLNNDISHEDRK